ncbi:class E sortase [Streptomyces sp. B-S-A8]|uniref:Class E sortase n=1 Tax=Streptomyces solicavernae TaxID=3043614 RepID=A0ABT6RR60_9ACTN|nr:class E sortase [Streptomyces sp. B-S-A8]MDI3386927.1 class E sortase [Streptomyces sp. B-S-A8]
MVVQGARRSGLARAAWCGGEIAVTVGLVLLLLVVHQLWWTNRQARDAAEEKVEALERQWRNQDGPAGPSGPSGPSEPAGPAVGPTPTEPGNAPADDRPAARESRGPAPPRWDQAYAVLSIPKLGVRVPVAEGVGKAGVLDKGYVGHYPRTAQPGRPGNFAVAGHRNTHGEPFRYVNRLRPGDRIEVRTAQASYTYEVDRTLPQTLPGDGGVIDPVPRSAVKAGAGYEERGYYITLTTCTPEFSSEYRLVVWGKLQSARAR